MRRLFGAVQQHKREVMLWLLVSLTIGLLGGVRVQASDKELPDNVTLAIFTAHFDGQLDDNPASGFNQLLDYVFEGAPAGWQRYKSAIPRTVRDFKITSRSCIFPSLERVTDLLDGEVTADQLVLGETVDLVSSHIMTRIGDPLIRSAADMQGKTIAIQGGLNSPVILELSKNLPVVLAPSQLHALNLLAVGRVDMIYGWNPNILIVAAQNGFEQPQFDPNFIIDGGWTRFVCKKFDGVEAFMAWTNERIKSLKKEGQLQEMLGEYVTAAP